MFPPPRLDPSVSDVINCQELFAHFDLDTAKKRTAIHVAFRDERFINFELVLLLQFRVSLVETLNSVLYFISRPKV